MKRLVCLLLLCSSAFAAPPKPGDKLGNDFVVMERGHVDTSPPRDPRDGDTRITLRATTRDVLPTCPRSTQIGMDCIDYIATRWPITLRPDGTITLGKPVETHNVVATPQYHIDHES